MVNPGHRQSHTGELWLRQRLKRLLNTVEWRPSGMSPSAVLIVRQLSDPLPGQLAPLPSAVRAAPAWESAMKSEMSRLYRTAARPFRGQLPPNPTAVLFADEAEMLACLALDMARGYAVHRWYWSALGRARPRLSLSDLPRLLTEQPRLIPPILACLQQWQQTTTVLKKLSPAQTTSILTAVTQNFHLPPLPPVAATTQTAEAVQEKSPFIEPPWQPFLPPPAVPDTFSPIQACLLGLSLSLTYRPAAVAAPAYIQQLHRWWPAQTRPKPATKEPAPSAGTQETALIETAVSPAGSPPPKAAPTGQRPEPQSQQEAASKTTDSTLNPSPSRPARATAEKAAPWLGTTESAEQEAVPLPVQDRRPESDALFESGQMTRLGGVFYLVNLMLRFDIPACFEGGWALASRVGAWGTLELLARGLLAEVQPPPLDDPIWAILAELDGRNPLEPPGQSYSRPTTGDNTLPPFMAGWGEPAGEDEVRQTAGRPLLAVVNRDLLQWLLLVLPAIRRHLTAALGLEVSGDLAQELLRMNGRLHVTTTHVDLVMSLEAISPPVRRASLDFDPGWALSFGRIIQFHYE